MTPTRLRSEHVPSMTPSLAADARPRRRRTPRTRPRGPAGLVAGSPGPSDRRGHDRLSLYRGHPHQLHRQDDRPRSRRVGRPGQLPVHPGLARLPPDGRAHGGLHDCCRRPEDRRRADPGTGHQRELQGPHPPARRLSVALDFADLYRGTGLALDLGRPDRRRQPDADEFRA